MIHTDGRPTIANAPARPTSGSVPGQMTVEECIELARLELELDNLNWPPAEPTYGGHN